MPPEIARFRKPGTQVKCIRGHYYLAKAASRWDPVARKARKVYLGHLGTATEKGITPKRTARRPVNAKAYSKEFGATWAVAELTKDIHENLKRHFPDDADWLYVAALPRCVRRSAMRYTEHLYGASHLSERFLGLNLSSSDLPGLMTGLGFRRRDMAASMRGFIPARNTYMLFDGTAMVCNPANIYEARRGYSGHGRHAPQTNLMYAAAVSGEKPMPVFYKRFPGSIRDMSAYENMRNEMGARQYIAIGDKGFVKEKD